MEGCIGRDAGMTSEIMVLILLSCAVPSEDCVCTPSEDVSPSEDGRFIRGSMSGVSSLCSNSVILSSTPCVLVGMDGVSICGS